MLQISFELPVNAEPELIWKYYAEFELRQQWEEDLEEYTLHGPFETGTQGSMRLTGMPPIQFTFTSVTTNEVFWDHVELQGLGILRFGHELFMRNNQRYVKHTTVFEPASGTVTEKDFQFFKQVSGDLSDVLWRLKNLVEQS